MGSLLNCTIIYNFSHTSILLKIWDIVLWTDDWKRGGLYFVIFAPACFAHPAEVELAVPAGKFNRNLEKFINSVKKQC